MVQTISVRSVSGIYNEDSYNFEKWQADSCVQGEFGNPEEHVESSYQATVIEDWEDFIYFVVAVNFGVCNSVKLSYLILITNVKFLIIRLRILTQFLAIIMRQYYSLLTLGSVVWFWVLPLGLSLIVIYMSYKRINFENIFHKCIQQWIGKCPYQSRRNIIHFPFVEHTACWIIV
jgi:hypothetical protein